MTKKGKQEGYIKQEENYAEEDRIQNAPEERANKKDCKSRKKQRTTRREKKKEEKKRDDRMDDECTDEP